jgi:hypothetical protein
MNEVDEKSLEFSLFWSSKLEDCNEAIDYNYLLALDLAPNSIPNAKYMPNQMVIIGIYNIHLSLLGELPIK